VFELIAAFAVALAFVYAFALACFVLTFRDRARKLAQPSRSLQIFSIWCYALASLTTVCIAYGYFIEPYWIEVTSVDIETEKLQNVSLRIVQISDTHCDLKIRNEHKLAEIINPLDPDLIVFTGDAINEREALQNFRTMMRGLKAKIGKYAVHGIWDDNQEHSPLFVDTGFQPLRKEILGLSKDGERFRLAGFSFSFADEARRAVLDLGPNQYTIFLHHHPDLIEDLSDLHVDLYLSGHTHGGQVALPLYGALMTLSKFGKKYEAGRYIVGRTTLYVNRGIGMEGGYAPRVRFLARPEITVLNIRPKRTGKTT
jgi:uncharacterized protein